jgi:F-type H+-transporting ATPase subunit b
MLDQLGVDPYKLAIQAFNFLLLLFILHRLAYRPLVRMMDERSTRIRSDLDEARRLREEAEQDRQLYRSQLGQARDEARAILDEASSVASRLRAQALADAEAQNTALLGRARAEIAHEKDAAISELRREVADLAILAASQVVRRSLDGADQRRLVQEALAEVEAK